MYPNLLNFRIPFPQILRVEISPFACSVWGNREKKEGPGVANPEKCHFNYDHLVSPGQLTVNVCNMTISG